MIDRADFVGFTVLGPGMRPCTSYNAKGNNAWPKGWSARLEGQSLILEGEGRRIEVPRGLCIVTHVPDAVPIAPSADVAPVAKVGGRK